jgi:LmbE family N-acetylglucosaminyl deacetylase
MFLPDWANVIMKVMRILYIFPHPDDESFGPAPVMKKQIDEGHEVFLLTLTRGGATKVRHKLGLTIEEMGAIRYKEMLEVEKVLQLTGMTVLDLPDSQLSELDPIDLESIVRKHIAEIEPAMIVTYPVHGVSGFHDHIVTHAIVKRVFIQMKKDGAEFLKRLAFITLPNKVTEPMQKGFFLLKQSDLSLIDCEVLLDEEDKKVLIAALNCYDTYQETISNSGVIEKIGDKVHFEIFGEDFKPVLSDLTERM